jgi:transcriptional regulator GlxA family with amidase domain
MEYAQKEISTFRIAMRGGDCQAANTLVQSRLTDPQLDQRVRVALELLLKGCGTNDSAITIRHVPRVVNMSLSRFRHLFKAEMGLSPTQLLKVQRLCRARSLLLTTFLSVKQIIAGIGVHDVSHFVKDYHAAFGESTTQTRVTKVASTTAAIMAKIRGIEIRFSPDLMRPRSRVVNGEMWFCG